MTVTTWILAIALVCIIEGFIPFLNPEGWLKMLREVGGSARPESVRRFGLGLLATGVAIIWFVTA